MTRELQTLSEAMNMSSPIAWVALDVIKVLTVLSDNTVTVSTVAWTDLIEDKKSRNSRGNLQVHCLEVFKGFYLRQKKHYKVGRL